MYRYKYNTSYHHKSRRARRSTVLAISLVLLVLGSVTYVAVDTFFQEAKKTEVTSQPTFSSVQGASINLFRTEYFQFQVDSTWKEVPTENSKGHYVYRSFKGPLVEHDIVIDVDNPKAVDVPANVRTNHVMPVEVDSTGKFNIISGAGEHCKTVLPKNSPLVATQVTQKQVTFLCSPDSVLYQVKVGLVGGTTQMVLPRPDGTRATYVITYRNLKFTPDDTTLRTIVDTFQTR